MTGFTLQLEGIRFVYPDKPRALSLAVESFAFVDFGEGRP